MMHLFSLFSDHPCWNHLQMGRLQYPSHEERYCKLCSMLCLQLGWALQTCRCLAHSFCAWLWRRRWSQPRVQLRRQSRQQRQRWPLSSYFYCLRWCWSQPHFVSFLMEWIQQMRWKHPKKWSDMMMWILLNS